MAWALGHLKALQVIWMCSQDSKSLLHWLIFPNHKAFRITPTLYLCLKLSQIFDNLSMKINNDHNVYNEMKVAVHEFTFIQRKKEMGERVGTAL